MATTIKSLVTFTAVPPGGQVSLPHNLKVGTRAVRPDIAERSSARFTVVLAFTDTNQVTVRNDSLVVADCLVLCEYWHTIERAFGAAQVVQLSPQTFSPDNDVAGLVTADSLQTSYDGGSTIALSTLRQGIQIVDAPAVLVQPMLSLNHIGANTQDMIRLTRGFGSGGGNCLRIDNEAAGGNGILIEQRSSTGIRIQEDAGSVATGPAISIAYAAAGSTAAGIVMTNSATGGTGIMLDLAKTPAANTAGIMVRLSSNNFHTTSLLQIVSSTQGDTFNINHTPAAALGSATVVILRSPTVVLGGNLLTLSGGANMTGDVLAAVASSTAGGAVARLTNNAGAGTILILTKLPAVATGGSVISITTNTNVTGDMFSITHAGTGRLAAITHTGTGTGIDWADTGSAGSLISINRTTNATTIMVSLTRTPPIVGTGGEILRLTGAGAGGIGLRVLGFSPAGAIGIQCNMQGAGAGIRVVEDIPGTPNTGIGIEVIRSLNGSTGIGLQCSKNVGAGAATAGDLSVFSMGGGAGVTTGHIFNITAGVNHTGRVLNLSHLGTGEIWRMTGAAGAILSVMTVDGRLGLGVVTPTPASGSFPLTAFKRSGAGFVGSETQEFHGTGATVGAVTADIATILLADNTAYVIRADVVGRAADGTEWAAFSIARGFRRQGGGAATAIGALATMLNNETVVGSDASLEVAANSVVVRVTGTVGRTYAWSTRVTVTPVATA